MVRGDEARDPGFDDCDLHRNDYGHDRWADVSVVSLAAV
jgi:hypothetical protein